MIIIICICCIIPFVIFKNEILFKNFIFTIIVVISIFFVIPIGIYSLWLTYSALKAYDKKDFKEFIRKNDRAKNNAINFLIIGVYQTLSLIYYIKLYYNKI